MGITKHELKSLFWSTYRISAHYLMLRLYLFLSNSLRPAYCLALQYIKKEFRFENNTLARVEHLQHSF